MKQSTGALMQRPGFVSTPIAQKPKLRYNIPWPLIFTTERSIDDAISCPHMVLAAL